MTASNTWIKWKNNVKLNEWGAINNSKGTMINYCAPNKGTMITYRAQHFMPQICQKWAKHPIVELRNNEIKDRFLASSVK